MRYLLHAEVNMKSTFISRQTAKKLLIGGCKICERSFARIDTRDYLWHRGGDNQRIERHLKYRERLLEAINELYQPCFNIP